MKKTLTTTEQATLSTYARGAHCTRGYADMDNDEMSIAESFSLFVDMLQQFKKVRLGTKLTITISATRSIGE